MPETYRIYFTQVMLVGLGGFVGSSARFIVGGLVYRVFSAGAFPYGTLVVNLVGCLAIGILGGLLEIRQMVQPWQRWFLMVGVLGGFTTFSTFAYETLSMAHAADFAKAAANIVVHVVAGLAAAWLGYQCAQSL